MSNGLARRFVLALLATLMGARSIPPARAQDMEPRAYSASPVGTNFAVLGYGYQTGNVVLDPSLPITDVEAKIHAVVPAYSHTFGLLGRQASIAGAFPYIHGDVSGMVGENNREVTRDGLGDIRLRFAANLLGGAALTPEEFTQRIPGTVAGVSLSAVAPTGDYNSEHLVNIGSNRWAFKPELGVSQSIGNWFIEGSSGVWLFTDNHNFYGGTERSQDPIATFQLHGGYSFLPGLWLAANGTFYTGGRTSINGVEKNDLQTNSRYGTTLAIPLSKQFSFKLAFSKGLTTRTGGDFTAYTAAIQYRWFND